MVADQATDRSSGELLVQPVQVYVSARGFVLQIWRDQVFRFEVSRKYTYDQSPPPRSYIDQRIRR